MAFPTFPTPPDPWPVRTHDQETFDISVAATFNFYDGLETWAAGFEAEADTLAGALVAANLPSLTGQAGKLPFVNSTGTAVQMDKPSITESLTAVTLGKVGDYDTSSWANAVADTITLDAGKIYTVLMKGFYRFRATSSTDLLYGAKIVFDDSSQLLSETTGTLTGSGDNEQFSTWSLLRVAGSGIVTVKLQARCDDNVELDRAHLGISAMRTA